MVKDVEIVEWSRIYKLWNGQEWLNSGMFHRIKKILNRSELESSGLIQNVENLKVSRMGNFWNDPEYKKAQR